MARGKIQIKRIQNSTNRQVTYSKRRNGLFKKARELTVLCDAKVSVITISSTDKAHEYISPSITQKELYDKYQQALEIDLWKTHYERMQDELRKLNEVNMNLRRDIRQRMGGSLENLNFHDLQLLQDDIESSLQLLRARKLKQLASQIENSKKKVRNGEQIGRSLVQNLETIVDPHYGLVNNNGGGGGDYDSMVSFHNGYPRIFALRLQPN